VVHGTRFKGKEKGANILAAGGKRETDEKGKFIVRNQTGAGRWGQDRLFGQFVKYLFPGVARLRRNSWGEQRGKGATWRGE